MALSVEIEKHSGFCGGVIRAIGRAEKFLDSAPGRKLYSLGAIVHNEAELSRLGAKGLVTIGHDDIGNIPSPAEETLLIRAHGEPPETYELARRAGINVIDCTCPVVLRLQQSIREAYQRMKPEGASGQIIIFGKVGHAEVLGLLGQVGGDAVVIENMSMLQEALGDGTIRTDRPLEIFSQTTKSPTEYSEICNVLSERAEAGLAVHQTICSQVASRHAELAEFSLSHDVILFVSGASSSNGKVLCDLCRSKNPRTYHISSPSDIDPSWIHSDDRVGICGATSTPRWLLEQVASKVSSLSF
ncbi:MAG: 4-hydroxy-3-methylbut-2-enyl diphosphate reductase [Bacteroidales bacterium]|nr:4-hydroxy-3-methylbut-2-enyl diphosphate reductase [Bacteroidales bacterium]